MEIKQAQVLVRAIAGQSPSEIGKILGVDRTTIHRWINEPGLKEKLRESSDRLFDAAIAELSLVATEAAEQLSEIIRNPDTRTSDRLKAIQMVFDNLARVKEWGLDARLERLERLIDEGTIEVEAGEVREESSIENQP